jgi:hypothetical protein
MEAFPPLIGRHWELQGAMLGAFVSSFIVGDTGAIGFRRNLRPAAAIVFMTLIAISATYALAQVTKHGQRLDFEPFGLLIWELVATSWWLIPGTAIVLALLSAVFRGRD